ncbi:sigma-70 family RNA polymerase sigma factor [Gracilibacillus thailandensis]|jgi:RNA polymerase sigma factor (sigma-70 family)|uniref:Sigma-70 family RNA polymerase sigma factor n=1 Tax=Gracilibacillus thailandensis TaxID=563735 RepID=A0A6N7R2C9_9BACI|nr:sigma-70 family RNA polymerase sigma factor [Gracilibacillus thailandensis]MRI67621.1 sigma-70 family RNA polymerase sigma factor [Gracilibacillus thailandensis]
MHEEQLTDQTNQEILIDLMEKYGDIVFRIAFTYVKEKHLAEDLAQEIFIKCYQSLNTFQNRSSYSTWLYRITVNYCKDYVKSNYFRNLIPQPFIKPKYEQVEDSVVSQILKNEENALLFHKVLKLTVKLREVIIFYYYEGLSIDEISNILKVKPNTVKTRLYRARKNLKSHIEGGMIFEE